MDVLPPNQNSIIPILIGMVAFIFGKIIWDWLSKRKNQPQFCALHENMEKLINKLEKEVVLYRTRMVDRDEFKELMLEYNRKIDGLDSKIDDMKSDMTNIRLSLAAEGIYSKKEKKI